MLTHLIKSINWVDVTLAILFVRMILVGIRSGFVSEIFKLLGVVAAVFTSFHFYSVIAAWLAEKTNFFSNYWDLVVFGDLWLAVALISKLFRESIFLLFKVETTHQEFDKYASGIVAVARGILVCSLTIYLVLLTHNGPLTRMTLHSYSYKLAGRAGLNTYSFLYKNLVDKLFAGEHYNAAAAQVLLPDGHWSKERK